ncbi:hypothetical protein CWI38_0015p0020 [Hamiltosporidium tvaerminnensis]|uniref:Uncharacterized protein n=1 Tax=Hamiltosporidium tvaerminnensis TaxID=1176355 RepID=A0A4Q9M277_9MICR|nr:hypothetical protein CWI38_0015p0020 [Hamiltosporidium tvaerminnensis]
MENENFNQIYILLKNVKLIHINDSLRGFKNIRIRPGEEHCSAMFRIESILVSRRLYRVATNCSKIFGNDYTSWHNEEEIYENELRRLNFSKTLNQNSE